VEEEDEKRWRGVGRRSGNKKKHASRNSSSISAIFVPTISFVLCELGDEMNPSKVDACGA
jgi:hypothetical protein